MKILKTLAAISLTTALIGCDGMSLGGASKSVVVYGFASKTQLVQNSVDPACSRSAVSEFGAQNKNRNDYGFGAIVAFSNSDGQCAWQAYKYMHSVDASIDAAQAAIKADIGVKGQVVATITPLNYTPSNAMTLIDWDKGREWIKETYMGRPNFGAMAASPLGDLGAYSGATDLAMARTEALKDCQMNIDEKIQEYAAIRALNATKTLKCTIVHERTPEGLKSPLTVH